MPKIDARQFLQVTSLESDSMNKFGGLAKVDCVLRWWKLLIFMSGASVAWCLEVDRQRGKEREQRLRKPFSIFNGRSSFSCRTLRARNFHVAKYFDSIFSSKLNCSTVCATVTVFHAPCRTLNTLSGGKWLLLNIFTQRTVKKCIEWHIGTKEWATTYIIHTHTYTDDRRRQQFAIQFSRANKKICEINEIYELVIVAQAIF